LGRETAQAGPAAKRKGEEAAQLSGWCFANKRSKFKLGVKLEFEFDFHSNSNFTHLNSKKKQ
jgi:hypothetical protein